jgi:hypothetical protein
MISSIFFCLKFGVKSAKSIVKSSYYSIMIMGGENYEET